MKEKKAKLKLEDIKVDSFITSLDDNLLHKVNGKAAGTKEAICATYNDKSCACSSNYATECCSVDYLSQCCSADYASQCCSVDYVTQCC